MGFPPAPFASGATTVLWQGAPGVTTGTHLPAADPTALQTCRPVQRSAAKQSQLLASVLLRIFLNFSSVLLTKQLVHQPLLIIHSTNQQ